MLSPCLSVVPTSAQYKEQRILSLLSRIVRSLNKSAHHLVQNNPIINHRSLCKCRRCRPRFGGTVLSRPTYRGRISFIDVILIHRSHNIREAIFSQSMKFVSLVSQSFSLSLSKFIHIFAVFTLDGADSETGGGNKHCYFWLMLPPTDVLPKPTPTSVFPREKCPLPALPPRSASVWKIEATPHYFARLTLSIDKVSSELSLSSRI